jgi:ligand-binding sensor domain-containing protein
MTRAIVALMVLVFCSRAFTDVIDSSTFGNNMMEWRTYASGQPVRAFTNDGAIIWYATANQTGYVNVKTGKKKLVPKLGGLPASGVTDMCTDSTGVVWIATPAGVARVTGSKITSYTADNGLVDNAVNCVHPAPNAVWVGTEKGVSVWKGGAWKSYTTQEGLCGNAVRDITHDNRGRVWLATNNGIAVFDGSSWSSHTTGTGLSSNDVHQIAFDTRKEDIWAAVGESDVNHFDGEEWNVFMEIQAGITDIMTDTQSRIWFGSPDGMFKYNGFEWVYDPQKIRIPVSVAYQMIRDRNGDLWFGYEGGVLHMNNPYPF